MDFYFVLVHQLRPPREGREDIINYEFFHYCAFNRLFTVFIEFLGLQVLIVSLPYIFPYIYIYDIVALSEYHFLVEKVC